MLIEPPANRLLPVECKLSATLEPWLTHPHSLTERLIMKAGHAHLNVLRQSWQATDWWDKQMFQVQDSTVWHREIVMTASDEPCWYARTIIPRTTYEANEKTFDRLQKESLGKIIFNDSRIERLFLFHYPIDAKSIEYYWLNDMLHQHSKIVWVRLSAFSIDKNTPFYLVEIMLPGLMRYPN